MIPIASIELPFDPNLIGTWLTWHGLLSAIGVVLAIWLTIFGSRRLVPFDTIYTTALLSTLGGLIGARIVHIVDNLALYDSPLDFFKVWEGGIGLWGTLLGASLTALVSFRYIYRLNWRVIGGLFDVVAIAAPLGIAFGRLGDFINGEHCATATDLPWGFIYTNPISSGYHCVTQSARVSQSYFEVGIDPLTTAVHPATTYEMLWLVLGVVVLLLLRGRLQPAGSLVLVTFLWYAIGRFMIQFVRLDKAYFGVLQEAHLIAIGTILAVVVGFVILRTHWDKGVKKPLWVGLRFPSAWADLKKSLQIPDGRNTKRKPKNRRY